MLKEGYEDYFRSKSDKEVNNAESWVLSQDKKEFVAIRFQDIEVGSIVKVNENQTFPADLVFLACDN
jgi:phospholipid-transporting ATPase